MSNNKEYWLGIKKYSDKYEVSSLGNVRNSSTKRILKQKEFKGELWVILTHEGKQKSHKVARLVYDNFIGDCPQNIRWKNKKRLDNRATNLIAVKPKPTF